MSVTSPTNLSRIENGVMMAVYLLHFSEPYPNGVPSQHYCGYARNVNQRVKKHMNPNANTAALVRAMHEHGIGFVLARVWPDGDPTFERKLKRSHNLRRYCPICKEQATEANRERESNRRKNVRLSDLMRHACEYEIEVGTDIDMFGNEMSIYRPCGVIDCKEHHDL